jgi:hypothetical protein
MDYFPDSMKRVHRLFSVAQSFAAKGVEKDDDPVWIAGTFSILLELIENELELSVAQINRAPLAEAKPANDRPDA